MKTGLISAVIPAYEHAHTLPLCLDALFAQTYPWLEVIVVDDGSTDNTAEVLAAYEDRLTVIRQENKGANAARNRGLLEVRGEFVIFVDADVIMQPEMLMKLKHALDEHKDASLAYSGFRFGWKVFHGVPFDKQRLLKSNYIHTTSLVRRQDFPGFDERIRRLQDWDVWLTMVEAGKQGVLVPEVLFTVRIDGASRIGSSWLPKFVYQIPWQRLPWVPERIKKYEEAKAVLVEKHHFEL